MKYPNIVIFGGGSGLSSIIEGLKHYPLNLTAVVSVADNGGSSGIIREFFNISPPGDLRKVIEAMSSDEETFKPLLNYRFSQGDNPFSFHTLGNIILTALSNIYDGSIIKACNHLAKILRVKGKILPVSDKPVSLEAVFTDGRIIKGEEEIALYGGKIKELRAIPNDNINEDIIEAIAQADMIIYSPGSLYTSLIASLVYPRILEQITKSNAIKVYVANIMTQKGETDHFKLSDHILELTKYIGVHNLDVVLANDNLNVNQEVLSNYALEGAYLVEPDLAECKKINVIMKTGRLINIDEGLIRHNHFKNAAYLFNLLVEMDV